MRTEEPITPTADELRQSLIARAQQFCELTGTTKSDLGRKAVGDVAFIGELESGRNITFGTYDKLRTYLDRHWPADPPKKRRRPS